MRLLIMARPNHLPKLHPLEPVCRVQQNLRALSAKGGKPDQLMIDAPLLKAHRTAASLIEKGYSHTYWTHQSGQNSKLNAVCDGKGKPLITLLSEGQISDYSCAA